MKLTLCYKSDKIMKATEEQIKNQIKSGYGFYGMKYKRATTKEEKNKVIENCLNEIGK